MNEDTRITVARALWQAGVIEVSGDEPFTLASGNRSPLYADCRRLISFPEARSVVMDVAQRAIEDEQIALDVVAGGESAGIPFGAWLADRMDLPFVYIRKKPKAYGRRAQIEGVLESGQTVLLFEDMITDGGSKLNFINAIRKVDARVNTCLVILDRNQGGMRTLAEQGVTLHALTDLDTTIAVGRETGLLSSEQVRSVKDYLSDAQAWHQARGLPYISRA